MIWSEVPAPPDTRGGESSGPSPHSAASNVAEAFDGMMRVGGVEEEESASIGLGDGIGKGG